MPTVREARLDDVAAICEVHKSDTPRWTRRGPSGETEVAYEQLTLRERWLHGGPWMSPETCAPYLNALLLSGQTALVATDDEGKVVGEIEVFAGEEPSLGRCAHISVLVVLSAAQRRGSGRALVAEAQRRADVAGCDWVTLRPADPAVEFYRKCGITEVLSRQRDVRVAVGDLPSPSRTHPSSPGPLDSYAPLAARALSLGRYQSSFHTWKVMQYRLAGLFDDLLVEEGAVPDLDTYYRIARSMTSPPGVREAYLNAWTGMGPSRREVLLTLGSRVRELGFEALWTAVDEREMGILDGLTTREREAFVILGRRLRPDGREV
jgi:GNAT superfamily N-acetyltransferase